MRTSLALLLLALSGAPFLQAQSAATIEFDNGQWFDGNGFKRGTVYSVNGILRYKKPTAIGQTVDLAGGYVVPPFGDADARYSGTATLQLLSEGIFYALAQDGPQAGSAANTPQNVDVAFAGEPEQASRPDMIRILIGPNGTTASEATNIVLQSYAKKLRTVARIDSAADYRAAVAADVDLILRLPNGALSKADAAQTARQRIQVVTAGGTAETKAANLRLLKSARVELVLAGDGALATARGEALQLHALGVFSNRELLKMWSEITPRAIFPTRRIGYLRDSYEASFVVLKQNPLKDFSAAVQQITHRFKKGRQLAL